MLPRIAHCSLILLHHSPSLSLWNQPNWWVMYVGMREKTARPDSLNARRRGGRGWSAPASTNQSTSRWRSTNERPGWGEWRGHQGIKEMCLAVAGIRGLCNKWGILDEKSCPDCSYGMSRDTLMLPNRLNTNDQNKLYLINKDTTDHFIGLGMRSLKY